MIQWREIHDRADADLALAFGRWFWPVFVEHDRNALIEHRAVDGAIADALERAERDPHRGDELPGRELLRFRFRSFPSADPTVG